MTLRQMPSWMSNKMGRLSFLTAEPMYHCVISGSTLATIGRQSCKGPHGSVADVPQPSVPLSLCPQPVSAAPRSGTLQKRAPSLPASAPVVQHLGQGHPETISGKKGRDTATRKTDLFKLSGYWIVKASLDMVLREAQLFGF